ncbi:hypothetical protein B0H17DRAFT_1151716 [Mycena rosella]|uniref:Uncharacterized protein n=1 Tax=Mycena rosella TaxID=1033263 RepID=A0AAD7BIB9_MYCRO|nr:hypothetical protein B0H17DRAFT_1151716 [Mycena rosella]
MKTQAVPTRLKPENNLRRIERLGTGYKPLASGFRPVPIPSKATSRLDPFQLIWGFSDRSPCDRGGHGQSGDIILQPGSLSGGNESTSCGVGEGEKTQGRGPSIDTHRHAPRHITSWDACRKPRHFKPQSWRSRESLVAVTILGPCWGEKAEELRIEVENLKARLAAEEKTLPGNDDPDTHLAQENIASVHNDLDESKAAPMPEAGQNVPDI